MFKTNFHFSHSSGYNESMNEKIIIEVREQIQEDIITYCDGMPDDVITNLCQIVCDNSRSKNA